MRAVVGKRFQIYFFLEHEQPLPNYYGLTNCPEMMQIAVTSGGSGPCT